MVDPELEVVSALPSLGLELEDCLRESVLQRSGLDRWVISAPESRFCSSRRRPRAFVFLVVALLEINGVFASAQDTDPRSTARLRLGPVYVSPTLEIRDIGVDTNVYNESRIEPIKDFVMTAAPTFVATVGPPRARLTVRSETAFVYFAKQSSERSVNEDLSLAAQSTFARLTPFAEYSYLNTRERVSFEVDARARRVEQRAAGGLRVALTPKVTADVHGEYWQNDFDGDEIFNTYGLAAELNRTSNMWGGGVTYRLTPLTSINAVAEISKIRFVEASFRDTDTQQTLFGVDLNPRALISGSARVGYQRFRPLNALLPDFNGVVGNASVSYRLRSFTTVDFTFDRRTDFSYYVVEPYYVREGYGVFARRQLAPQWNIEVAVTRTSHQYLQILGTGGSTEEGHEERLFISDVTLGYDVGPRTRMTVGFEYSHRNSDFDDAREYDGVRVGVSMTYGF